jgi:hypothetical protein
MTWIFSVFSVGQAPVVFPGAPYVLSAALAVAGVLCIQRGSTPDRTDHLAQGA